MIMLRSNDDKKDLSGIYNMCQFIQSIKKKMRLYFTLFVAEFNFILIFQFLYKPRSETPLPRVVLRWSLPPSAVPVGRPAIRCTSRASGPGRPTQRDSPLMMVSFNYIVLEDLAQGKPFYMHWQYRSQFLSPSRPTLKDTPLMIVGISVLGR